MLCHAHLEGSDLYRANLSEVDLHQAHVDGADLGLADLRKTKLTRTSLRGVNLSQADLAGADLFKADLTDSRNLTDEQLAQAKRLCFATMPDGTPYNGRFNFRATSTWRAGARSIRRIRRRWRTFSGSPWRTTCAARASPSWRRRFPPDRDPDHVGRATGPP
jgi:hypothetical protein